MLLPGLTPELVQGYGFCDAVILRQAQDIPHDNPRPLWTGGLMFWLKENT